MGLSYNAHFFRGQTLGSRGPTSPCLRAGKTGSGGGEQSGFKATAILLNCRCRRHQRCRLCNLSVHIRPAPSGTGLGGTRVALASASVANAAAVVVAAAMSALEGGT